MRKYVNPQNRIIGDMELVKRVKKSIGTRGSGTNRIKVVRILEDVNDPGVRQKDVRDVAELLGYKTYNDKGLAYLSLGSFENDQKKDKK